MGVSHICASLVLIPALAAAPTAHAAPAKAAKASPTPAESAPAADPAPAQPAPEVQPAPAPPTPPSVAPAPTPTIPRVDPPPPRFETPPPYGNEPATTAAPPPSPPHFVTQTLPPRRTYRPPVGKATMAAGWSLFGASYVLSSFIGTLLIDEADSGPERDQERYDLGVRLLIPIGGPFAAIPTADTAFGAWGTAWLGIAQVTGLTLGIIGTTRYVRWQNRRLVGMAAVANKDGVRLGASWRF